MNTNPQTSKKTALHLSPSGFIVKKGARSFLCGISDAAKLFMDETVEYHSLVPNIDVKSLARFCKHRSHVHGIKFT